MLDWPYISTNQFKEYEHKMLTLMIIMTYMMITEVIHWFAYLERIDNGVPLDRFLKE